MADFYDVVIIGAGAAGVAAGRRLAEAGASFVVLEARERIGGRTLTLERGGAPVDMGAGWLHSADLNPLTELAEASGFAVDRTPAPWQRRGAALGMSADEQQGFGEAFARFQARIEAEAERDRVNAASFYLEPGGRWNAMLDAVFSYISGAGLDDIDARDYARYEDTGSNWRVRAGYGALIAALGAGLPMRLGMEAAEIEHGGAHVRVHALGGVVEARAAIVTLPTSAFAALKFTPDLPLKRAAAAVLPLGCAEKVHFALEGAQEFPADGRLFARTDSAETGAYHLRPLGRPLIEAYFGGALARRLAEAGGEAMADFAREELARVLGSSFPSRLTLLAASSWSTDPHARGSYSFATPGSADARAVLAAAHEKRLFFAGEACSRARYSTVHGAFETGIEAAEQALAALGQAEPSPRA
jgi:monoamine oxidase